MGDFYALDFDGVICDSCGESSLSAVKAAKVRWPSLFETVDSSMEAWIVDQIHRVSEGLTVEGILENWPKIKPAIMEEWEENKDALADLFGKSRFADALLREVGGVTIPPERIYGLGSGPKVKVLKQLQKKPEYQLRGRSTCNLEECSQGKAEPDGWNLYLERERASCKYI